MKKFKILKVLVEEDLLDDMLEESEDKFKVEEDEYTYLQPMTKSSQAAMLEEGVIEGGGIYFSPAVQYKSLEKTLSSGEISLFIDRKVVKKGTEVLRMTPGEIELLAYLMEHPFMVHSRELIAEELSKNGKYLTPESVTMRIQRIRKSLGESYINPDYIETRISLGYCWIKSSGIQYKYF